jgi:hypothetical protein
VMRGTTTTYSPGRLPGRQFVEPEVATPLQARQAWNREQANLATAAAERRGFTDPTIERRFGGFRAPEQTLKEATPGEPLGAAQERTMRGRLFEVEQRRIQRQEEQAVGDRAASRFDELAKRRYGTPSVDRKTGLITHTHPTDEYHLRDLGEAREYAREQGNTDAGMQYMEWSKRLRQMYPDVYATTMRDNPLAWREVVITHGPQLPAPTTASFREPAMTEPERFLTGQVSGFVPGP